jgi:hypothetical protein
MKVLWTFVMLVGMATMSMAGCAAPQDKLAMPVAVGTENGSPFPAALAGLWKSDRHGWEFVIEPNGRISSAVISFGRARIVPGQTAAIPTKTGEQAVFTPGPWAVHYDPAARMLTIKVTMDHVRVPASPDLIEGSSTDILCGVVSPSMDTWQVEWTMFTNYTVTTADGKSTDLSTDKTEGETQSLVFTKTARP